MFTRKDFEVFHIQGLEQRMIAIQEQIQPKFRTIGEQLRSSLSVHTGKEMFLHIAKHARRTVNPPKDTWLAICDNKRGYKGHPHFQLGLFDDHLFIWLALIYELPGKQQVAAGFLNQLDDVIAAVPQDYVISLDHMKKDSTAVHTLAEDDWKKLLIRLRDFKQCELLIGRHISPDSELLNSEENLLGYVENTFLQLLPLYELACQKARHTV